MMQISDEQIAAAHRAIAAMLPEGSMPIGFVLAVTYMDVDGDTNHSNFSNGLSIIERIGIARALSLESENLWQLPYCPWDRSDPDD